MEAVGAFEGAPQSGRGGDLGPGLGCSWDYFQEHMERSWTGGTRENKERTAGESTAKRLQGG